MSPVRKPAPPAVRVRVEVEQVDDPELERWLGHWLRRLLKAKSNPEEGR